MSGPAVGLRRQLGVVDLTLFNISVVAGVRGFSSLAQEGTRAIPLMLLCTLLYFLPMAVLFADLGRRFPQEGGFYVWIHEAFGAWPAFLSGWLYSVGMLLLFPTVILFGASIGPHILGARFAWLSDSPAFVLTATLLLLWGGTLVNVLGVRLATRLTSLGAISTYATLLILVAAALVLTRREPSATHFSFALTWNYSTFNSWAQMTYFVTGLELSGLLAGEIRDPERTVPRASLFSSIALALFYAAGVAAILAILPAGQVHPVNGIAQAAAVAGEALHAPWLPVLLAGAVVFSVAGQFAGFLASASRLPYLFGIDRYLPADFGKLHPRYRTPYVSVLGGAVVSTLFVFGMCLGETVRAAYLALFDACILLNAVPFLYLFAAGWKLGSRIAAGLGFLVTVTAMVFSVIPAGDVTHVWSFEAKLFGALATMTCVARLLYKR